jgi:hypothetical protein
MISENWQGKLKLWRERPRLPPPEWCTQRLSAGCLVAGGHGEWGAEVAVSWDMTPCSFVHVLVSTDRCGVVAGCKGLFQDSSNCVPN